MHRQRSPNGNRGSRNSGRARPKHCTTWPARPPRNQRGSLAFELVLEALRADPDFEPGRRILGYQKYDDGWYTAYEIRKLKAGQVWHDKFGWLPKAHVPRYEKGERWNGKRWITAEDDAKPRGKIDAGWDIETEHYRSAPTTASRRAWRWA